MRFAQYEIAEGFIVYNKETGNLEYTTIEDFNLPDDLLEGLEE